MGTPPAIRVMAIVQTAADAAVNAITGRYPTTALQSDEDGQGLVEYAIILALVAIVVIAVMRILGPKIGNTFSTINSSLP